MQRLLVIAGSVLALTACSHMEGMTKHHDTGYAKLAKIAKQYDAQNALLLTREGELVVVNVDTGDLIEPGAGRKEASQQDIATSGAKVSDDKFAEIQRKFNRTITLKATKGSVCMNIALQPPGQQWVICSPPYPKWW